jgi:zinc D-Ala-D-Ala carboxypeptidase
MHKVLRTLVIPTIFVLTLLVCCSRQNNPDNQCNAHPKDRQFLADNTGEHLANTLNDSTVDLNYLLGKFLPDTHALFVKIDPHLTTLKNGYVRKEVHQAFEQMHRAARRDGITLKIVSATRNFTAQKGIWEAKWNGARKVEGVDLTTVKDQFERSLKILRYSSMPGTSRHHWGTDIDINSVENAYFETEKGRKEFRWLAQHAANFGFCQTYTPKDSLRPHGYEEEPWHWSYTPVSGRLLAEYNKAVTYSHLRGFAGDQTADSLQVIRVYVGGINPRCR